jgi:hypothetical protein
MPWFVGRIRPCSEHITQRQIERHYGRLAVPQWNKGEHTYLPIFSDLKNRPRQCSFTFWVFIRQYGRYAFLFHIEALAYILMSDGHPAILKDAVIGQWRRREDTRGLVRMPSRRFNAGETVRVTYGPLKDQQVVYQGMSGSERAAVLMQLLGTETRATIDLQALDHL